MKIGIGTHYNTNNEFLFEILFNLLYKSELSFGNYQMKSLSGATQQRAPASSCFQNTSEEAKGAQTQESNKQPNKTKTGGETITCATATTQRKGNAAYQSKRAYV